MSKTCPFLPVMTRAVAADEYPKGAGACITCPREEQCVAKATRRTRKRGKR